MKCWIHPDIDAIGVCKFCGKNVCKECALTIREKTYCKTCVEAGKVSVTLPQPKGRYRSITIASIFFFILGAIEIIGSPFVSEVFGLVVGVPTGLIGVLDLIAGKLLWDNKKNGGILGIMLIIIGISTSIVWVSIGLVEFGYVLFGFLWDIFLIALIKGGWNTLEY